MMTLHGLNNEGGTGLPYAEGPMRRAMALAHHAAMIGEVPVGAVIYDPKTEQICAEAHNSPIACHDPTAHAEILAMRRAGEAIGNYRLSGLDLYVTLEPCTMCAGAISHARLRHVIFAAKDPKGGAVCNGVSFFDAKTCHWKPKCIHAHAFEYEAGQILRDFFANRR